jgi:hypothetical protein
MIHTAGSQLNGYLLELRWVDILAFPVTDSLDILESPSPIKGWSMLFVSTEEPILPEGPVESFNGGYKYTFALRRSGPHFLLAGHSQELVEQLLKIAEIRVSNPRINVSSLVKDLTSTPESYLLSAVYAKVEAFGASLRSLSFFGADLADARLFRETLNTCNPYRACLRDIRKKEDVLTIGSRGEVQFHYRGDSSLVDVDKALAFMTAKNYLDWGVRLDVSE